MPAAAAGASNTEILDAVSRMEHKLDLHIAMDSESMKKTADMYTKLVTGNGTPSLMERMRSAEGWIGKIGDPSRIDRIETWQANEKWVLGLMAAVFLADFISRMLQVWKGG